MILLALKLSSILVTPYSTIEMHKASGVKSLLSLSYLENALLLQVSEKALNTVSLFLLYLTHINHASFIAIHFVGHFFFFPKRTFSTKTCQVLCLLVVLWWVASGFSSLSDLNFHTLFKSLGIFYLFILFFKGAPGAPGPDGLTGTKGSMVSDVKCIKFMRKVSHV